MMLYKIIEVNFLCNDNAQKCISKTINPCNELSRQPQTTLPSTFLYLSLRNALYFGFDLLCKKVCRVEVDVHCVNKVRANLKHFFGTFNVQSTYTHAHVRTHTHTLLFMQKFFPLFIFLKLFTKKCITLCVDMQNSLVFSSG